MKGLKSAFLAAVMLAAPLTLAPTALAEPTESGVTIDDVANALSAGLVVTRAKTPGGIDVVHAQGKNHLVTAALLDCGKNGRCGGLWFLSVTDQKISASQANKFNYLHNYAKVVNNDDGQSLITLEQVVLGGVSSKNLLINALMLMTQMTEFNQEFSGTIAMAPARPDSNVSAQANAVAEAEMLRVPYGTPVTFRLSPSILLAIDKFAASRRH